MRGGGGAAGQLAHFPPPRADTTGFKFWLYETLYAIFITVLFLGIEQFDVVRNALDQVLALLPSGGPGLAMIQNADPILLALLVSVILPFCPPFNVADVAFRRWLYGCAFISARQVRDARRLAQEPFVVNSSDFEAVRNDLVAEGFDPKDVVYDADRATTASLWTKASVLVFRVRRLTEKLESTFEKLREKSAPENQRSRRSDECVFDRHESKKPEARACFEAIRNMPDDDQTKALEAAFR